MPLRHTSLPKPTPAQTLSGLQPKKLHWGFHTPDFANKQQLCFSDFQTSCILSEVIRHYHWLAAQSYKQFYQLRNNLDLRE